MAETKILTDIEMDDPVALTAAYQLDGNDRLYIDEQIRGLQQHAVESHLHGLIGTFYTLDSNSDALAAGDCVCICPSNITGRSVTKAYSGALSVAGRALGVAMTATAAGGTARVAIEGTVARTVTGLAAGSAQPVRVNTTTARAERVASLGPSDYPLGHADTAGNLTIWPGWAPTGVSGSRWTTDDKSLAAQTTTGDGDQAIGSGISNTPASDGYVGVRVNGQHVSVGDGVKTAACYFSGDSGTTARAIADIVATDTLHWVGSVAGYQLETDDLIDLVYEEGV